MGVREGTRPFLTDAQWDAEHGGDCNDPEKSLADSALSDPNVATAVRPPKGLPSFITEPPDPIGIGGAGNASNATGHPRFNANLALQSSIASSDNQLASYNFNFDIPIFDLPGRGVGIGLSLIYNSRMWTKDNNKIMGIMYLTNPTFFAIINPP